MIITFEKSYKYILQDAYPLPLDVLMDVYNKVANLVYEKIYEHIDEIYKHVDEKLRG